MSDTPQGPGWWQASDGKWYPPEQQPGYQEPAAGGGGMAGGGGTDVGSVLSYSFNKFIQNIGDWIVLWLIMIGIFIALTVVLVVVGVGTSASFGINFNPVGIIIQILFWAVLGCVMVAIAKAANMVVAGQKVDIAAAFKLSGNNIMAGAIWGAIYGLLASFCGLLGIIVWLFLGFVPVITAIEDKGFEAVTEAIELNNARLGETALFWLVAWLIGGFFCALGAPIAMIGGVYLYNRYKGLPVSPTS